MINAMLLCHAGHLVFLLDLRRIAVSAEGCSLQEDVHLDSSLMQLRATARRDNNTIGIDRTSTARGDVTAQNNATATVWVNDSASNHRSRASSPSLEPLAPRYLEQQRAQPLEKERKLGALEGREKILGFDLTDLILLVLIVVLSLAGLFLLWGGSPKELREHPWQAIEQTGESVISDPRLAWQKTEDSWAKNKQQYGGIDQWAQHEYQQLTEAQAPRGSQSPRQQTGSQSPRNVPPSQTQPIHGTAQGMTSSPSYRGMSQKQKASFGCC